MGCCIWWKSPSSWNGCLGSQQFTCLFSWKINTTNQRGNFGNGSDYKLSSWKFEGTRDQVGLQETGREKDKGMERNEV